MKNKAAQELGRLGGQTTTEAKAIAARENGAKGGRPKTTVKLTLLGDGVRIADNDFDGHYSYQELASVLAEYEPATVQELWDRLEESC